MIERFVKAVGAEDVALAGGTIALSVGAGIRFGLAGGLMVFGALAIAYGVWITEMGRG